MGDTAAAENWRQRCYKGATKLTVLKQRSFDHLSCSRVDVMELCAKIALLIHIFTADIDRHIASRYECMCRDNMPFDRAS